MFQITRNSIILLQACVFLIASSLAAASSVEEGRRLKRPVTKPASIGKFDKDFKALAASSGAGTLAYLAAGAFNSPKARRVVVAVFAFAFVLVLLTTLYDHLHTGGNSSDAAASTDATTEGESDST